MTIEVGTLNQDQRYNLEDLRFWGWQNSMGEEVDGENTMNYSPWSYFNKQDEYVGHDEYGYEPVFELDTDEQPHY